MMRVGDDRLRSRWVQVGVAGAALAVAFYAGRVTTPEKASGAAPETRKVSERGRGGNPAGALSVSEFKKLARGEEGAAELALATMNAREVAALVRSMIAVESENSPGFNSSAYDAAWDRWAELDPQAAVAGVAAVPQNWREWAFARVFAKWSELDPAAAEAGLGLVADPYLRSRLLRTVMDGLASRDADAWTARITREPSLANGTQISLLASKWVDEDPERALEKTAGLPTHLRKEFIKSIAEKWSQKDPAAAFAWARSLPPGGARREALEVTVQRMAASDPEGALAGVDALPLSLRSFVLARAFGKLAERDFEAAFQRACKWPDMKVREELVRNLFNSNSPGGLGVERFQKLILDLPPGTIRGHGLDLLAGMIAPLRPEDRNSILVRCSSEDRSVIERQMISSLTYPDPKGALALLESQTATGGDEGVIEGIVSTLAKQDPAAALRLALERTPPDDVGYRVQSMFENFAREDPQEAITRLGDLPAGNLRERALREIAGTWGRDDAGAAYAWAAALPAEDRQTAMAGLISGVSQLDSRMAAELVGRQLTSSADPADVDLANEVAESWSRDDPEAAREWVMGLPEGQGKLAALDRVAMSWAKADPVAAGQWLETMPGGEQRDRAAAAMSMRVSDGIDPQQGLSWALSIADGGARVQAAATVFSNWKGHDPEAARAAVMAGGFSEQERARYLKALEK